MDAVWSFSLYWYLPLYLVVVVRPWPSHLRSLSLALSLFPSLPFSFSTCLPPSLSLYLPPPSLYLAVVRGAVRVGEEHSEAEVGSPRLQVRAEKPRAAPAKQHTRARWCAMVRFVRALCCTSCAASGGTQTRRAPPARAAL